MGCDLLLRGQATTYLMLSLCKKKPRVKFARVAPMATMRPRQYSIHCYSTLTISAKLKPESSLSSLPAVHRHWEFV